MKKILLLSIIILIIVLGCEDYSTNSALDESALIRDKLYNYFDSLQTVTEIPGIVAGVWVPSKNVEMIESFGYANIDNQAPMSTELTFRIASNTKTMTNTILLQLIDEGKISLSNSLSEYYPDFPNSNNVDIQMLTDMTSGIPEYIESPKINEWLSVSPDIYFPIDSLLAFASEMDYVFPPGEGFKYSNTNTLLIEKIITQITGNSLKYEMRTRLFEPLGLTVTDYLESGTAIPDPHPRGYYMGEVTNPPQDVTELFDISLVHGAGAGVSNLRELKRYVEYLVGGCYLSEEMQAHRLQNLVEVPEAPFSLNYGTGWMELNGFYGHDGGFPGFVSLMLNNPNDNTTIIFWFNCQLFEYDVLSVFLDIHNIIYSNENKKSNGFSLENFRLKLD